MTAKNLAIVWAPNLLRNPRELSSTNNNSKSGSNNNNNLKDIALQAVCIEFMIKYVDVIFSTEVDLNCLDKSFELGILPSSPNCTEIDIDGEINRRAAKMAGNVIKTDRSDRVRLRPKSVLFADLPTINSDDDGERGSEFRSTNPRLKRSTSSIVIKSPDKRPPMKNLSKFLVTKEKSSEVNQING